MSDAKALVQQAAQAYKAGNKTSAQELLLKAVDLDERNEQAWMLMSMIVESLEEQQICLENALAINPANERAQKGLAVINQKLASSGGASASSAAAPYSSAPAADPWNAPAQPTSNPFGSSPAASNPFENTADPWGAASAPAADPWNAGAPSTSSSSSPFGETADNAWGSTPASEPWGAASTPAADPWSSEAPSNAASSPFGEAADNAWGSAPAADPWGAASTPVADPWSSESPSTSSSSNPFGGASDSPWGSAPATPASDAWSTGTPAAADAWNSSPSSSAPANNIWGGASSTPTASWESASASGGPASADIDDFAFEEDAASAEIENLFVAEEEIRFDFDADSTYEVAEDTFYENDFEFDDVEIQLDEEISTSKAPGKSVSPYLQQIPEELRVSSGGGALKVVALAFLNALAAVGVVLALM
jgi:hypothetical protein